MKWQPKVVLVLLSVLTTVAVAQSSANDRSGAQDTQVRGYWIDPSTGLMWAGKDNGKNVDWKKAVKYCRELPLAGHSDWRLATLLELQGIYDKTATAPGRDAEGPSTWHVKGNLFLTGNQWANKPRNEGAGHSSGFEWYFDFNEGRSSNQPIGFLYSDSFMRALCVRGPETP